MNADIPDFKLERYLLNELDEAEMERIRQAVKSNESLQARLETLEQSNREISDKYPPRFMNQRIREKLGSVGAAPSTTRHRWRIQVPRAVLVPAALAAAIAFSVFVLPDLLPTGDPIGTEGTRIKGSESQLRLFRKINGGSEQLKNGDLVAEHDLILLRYQAKDEAYGAILSVDGRGKITTHLPAQGNQAASLESGQARFLDYAYELDDAPHWEAFFFVTAASPFHVDGVIQAFEELPFLTRPREEGGINENFLDALDLPDGFRISTFTLIKDSRHED